MFTKLIMELLMTKQFLRVFAIFLLFTSCMPKAPYEAKSPCVSNKSDNPYARNPCIRVPLNGRDIA